MGGKPDEILGLKESARRCKEVAARCADQHPGTAAVFERKADQLVAEIARQQNQQ